MIFETIVSFVSSIFKPATDLVSEAILDKDLAAKLNVELAKLQNDVQMKVLELEAKRMELESKLAENVAKTAQIEVGSDNLLTKTYRPLITIGIFGLIVASSFGYCQVDDILYQAFGAIFGITFGGRSVEKIISTIRK